MRGHTALKFAQIDASYLHTLIVLALIGWKKKIK